MLNAASVESGITRGRQMINQKKRKRKSDMKLLSTNQWSAILASLLLSEIDLFHGSWSTLVLIYLLRLLFHKASGVCLTCKAPCVGLNSHFGAVGREWAEIIVGTQAQVNTGTRFHAFALLCPLSHSFSTSPSHGETQRGTQKHFMCILCDCTPELFSLWEIICSWAMES